MSIVASCWLTSRTRALNLAALSSFASRCPYVVNIAPHPPAFVMIGASESKAAMFRRANSRAPSRSPACACSAPQQPCSTGASTANPLASNTRSVARFTRANSPSPTQPLNNNTLLPSRLSLPLCVFAGKTSFELSSNPTANATLRGINPEFNNNRASPKSRNTLDAPKNIRKRHRDNHTCRNTNRSNLFARSDLGCASSNTSRLASSNGPYSTPAGQTCSHARHPRHRSICVAKAVDVFSSLPSATARIKYNLPRGPSFSFPVMTYVGHASRHSPQ